MHRAVDELGEVLRGLPLYSNGRETRLRGATVRVQIAPEACIAEWFEGRPTIVGRPSSKRFLSPCTPTW